MADPMEAITRAQANLSAARKRRADAMLGLTTTSDYRTTAAQRAASTPVRPVAGREAVTATSGRRTQRVVIPGEVPSSPVNDRLRATPGTLQKNMMMLDRQYGNDPSYQLKRNEIKYRIQRLTDTYRAHPMQSLGEGLRGDLLLSDEARNIAALALGRSAPKTTVQRLGEALPTEMWDGSDAYSTAMRLMNEDRTTVPGNRTPMIDRVIQVGQAVETPKYDALGPVGSRAVRGAMSNLNVPANIAGMLAMPGLAADALAGKGPSAQGLIGYDPADPTGSIAEMAGSLIGGLLLGGPKLRGLRGTAAGVAEAEARAATVAAAEGAGATATRSAESLATAARAASSIEEPSARMAAMMRVADEHGITPGDVEAAVRRGSKARAHVKQRGAPAETPEPVVAAPEQPVGTAPGPVPHAARSAEGFPFTEERMDPNNIGVYPGMQYKRAGISDAENQVTDALKDAERYDQATAGPLTVWERTDGSRYVMNGHHRRELAIRTQEPDVPVRVFRESEGVDFRQARAMGALQNIRDGKGTALDAATVLRDMNATPEQLRSYGINPRSGVANNALSLLKLDPESLRFVEEGILTEEAVAGIVQSDLSPDRIPGALRYAARSATKPATKAEGLAFGEVAARAPTKAAGDSATLGLFDEVGDDLALGEQAKLLDGAYRSLATNRRMLDAMNRGRAVGGTVVDRTAQNEAASVAQFARDVMKTDPDVAAILEAEAKRYAETTTPKTLREGIERISDAAITGAERRLNELIGRGEGPGVRNDPGRTVSAPRPESGAPGRVESEPAASLTASSQPPSDIAPGAAPPAETPRFSPGQSPSQQMRRHLRGDDGIHDLARGADWSLVESSKPQYGYKSSRFTLEFDNPFDKAAYIVANAAKASKIEPRILEVARNAGITESELRAYGQTVRDTIKREAASRAARGEGGAIRYNRQRGAADLKTVAVVGGLGAAGLGAAAMIAQNPDAREWFRRNGAVGNIGLAAAGLAAVGAGLYGATRGRAMPGAAGFTAMKAALTPYEIGQRMLRSGEEGSRAFGQALRMATQAKGEHTSVFTEAMQRLHQRGSQIWGKNWLDHPELAEWDTRIRDVMEQNRAAGRDWAEGLPANVKEFVQGLRPLLNQPLNQWEALGGRVIAENNAWTRSRLTEMAKNGPLSLKLPGENFGTFDGLVRVATDTGEDFGIRVKLDDGSVQTIMPGKKFGRPTDRWGEAFVPRFFRGEFLDSLRTLRENPTLYREAIQKIYRGADPGDIAALGVKPDYLKSLMDMLERSNQHLGIHGDEALSQLIGMAEDADLNEGNTISFLHNLERGREMELAKFTLADGTVVDPYESSYIQSVQRYLNRSHMTVAVARQLGVAPDAIGGLLQHISRINPAYGRYLTDTVAQQLGIGNRSGTMGRTPDFLRQAARVEGSVQAITKMTGGTTPVNQLTDVTRAFTEAGTRHTLGALYDLTLGRGRDTARNVADILAAIHASDLEHLSMGEPGAATMGRGARGLIRKGIRQLRTPGQRIEGLGDLTSGVMSGIGVRWSDIAQKRVEALAYLRDAQATLTKSNELLRQGRGIPGAMARKLERYGLNPATKPESLTRTGRVSADFGAAVRRRMYSGLPEDFPNWMSAPGVPILTRFKKPMWTMTKFLMDSVVNEATRGNMVPLTRFIGYGLGVGTVGYAIKDLIRGDAFTTDVRERMARGDWGGALMKMVAEESANSLPAKFERAMTNPSKRKALQAMLFTAGDAMFQSGQLGVIGELGPMNPQNVDVTGRPTLDPANVVLPPVASDATSAYNRLQSALQSAASFERRFDPETYGLKGQIQSPMIDDLIGSFRNDRLTDAAIAQLKSSVLIANRLGKMLDLKTDRERIRELERREKAGSLSVAGQVQLNQLRQRAMGPYNEVAGRVESRLRARAPKTIRERVRDRMGVNADGTRREP